MDDETSGSGVRTNSTPSPSGGGDQQAGSSYRIRRPSSSLISSTTSPMFHAPANPTRQPPPSPLAHHSRQRHGQNNINSASVNNHFGPGDIDDDVQPSSNSNPRARASSSASSSVNHHRSQSPLGSPDSTYWGGGGPSPSPVFHHGHSSNNAGYRAPLTPGGMCVVSSSTSDDIPPSPFSPEEHGGHANLPPTPGPPPTVEISNIPSGSRSQGNLRLGGGQSDHLLPSPGPSSSLKNSILSSTISGLNRPHHLNSISQQNPDLSLNAASSSSSSSLYISPLRNKIKKASSFERFSLAQAIHNNSSSGGGNSSNNNVNCAEPLLERAREAPLNLTENGGAGSSQQSVLSLQPPRNPVISSQSLISQSKKIPLTPKQKLLHRMQSGELIVSLSPPPPPPPPQIQLQQQQHSAIQQTQSNSSTSPVANLHQNLQLAQETIQGCGSNSGNNHSISNNAPHSPVQLEPYSYESLIRNRDDFSVQEAEALGKVVNDDSNPQEAALLYDPDSYNNYYYQNILTDDIFSGNNASSSGLQAARQLLMMPPGNLQEGDQPHGHLEFVLGLSNGCDDNDRGRDDDIQLSNEGNPGSHQHFLDQNDALNAMKSQNQADSTLRNLLMMEPMRNNHNDDSWLTVEYQNRLNSDLISRVGRSNCGFIGGSGSQSVNSQNGQNSISNSWINEWPRSSSWQGHSSSGANEVIQDQDEVMDMSMMEQEKSISSHNKRLQHLQLQMQQQNNDDGIDEIDLTNGLPLLSMSIPMDLQQPMSILQHTGSTSSAPLHLQQHHNNHNKMDVDDDEPVNLIAANIEQELAAATHHQHLAHQSQSHSNYHPAANDSYTLQIQSHHPGTSVDLHHSMSASDDINGSTSSIVSDNMDERKFIRMRKNKDTLLLSALEDGHDGSSSTNVIMDKPVQAKAFASLPSPLNFQGVHPVGWAVFTARNKVIQTNTRLGPVDGPLKIAYAEDISNMNATYPCLIMKGCNNVLYQLDRANDDVCNWMKFVRQAHSIRDQNALVVEIDNHVYFVTNKEIPPKTELRVGFSLDYARKYGLPYLLTESQSEQVEQSRVTNHSNITGITISSSEVQAQVQQMQVGDDIQEIETSDLDEPPKSVKMTTVYPCFECDQEFNLVEELQVHLDKAHKDDEPEEICKPKKKVIKKLQQNSEALGEQIREPIIQETSGTSRQNQLMSADSSMGGAESSTFLSNGNSQRSWAETGTGKYFSNRSTSQGKAQDNSVSTGGGPPLAQSKVKCTMCYKAFLTVERLTRHMIVHSAEDTKPLKCSFCVKRFLTNSALAGHIKTHAEEGKCFECPMCQFSTQQLLCLKEHVQKHRNRDSGFFHCPQCSKRFGAYPMIRKHIRAFHGPRQFACDNCAMSFPTSDKLRLHQLKHSDHREFLCAECGRQFKRKDKLREHTKRVHEIKKKNTVELNIPKDKSGRKFASKSSLEDYKKYLYKCHDCLLGFKRRGMLVNHLAKRHPEKQMQLIPELNIPIIRPSRNYFCMYCERIYKSSSKRKAHILKSHPGKPTPPQMRSRDAGRYESFIVEPHIPSHVGTIVQTVTDDGDPRQGIMNVSCTKNISSTNGSTSGAGPSTSSTNASLVTTTSLQNSSGGRKETVAGKSVGTPHPCPWCYRQYATRAKNLQHQRKQHINLMTPELQLPRTQKNNVGKAKVDKSHSEATAAPVTPKTTSTTPVSSGSTSASTITQEADLDAVIPDSSTSATTTTTIQTVAPGSLPVNEPNVIGFLLTTNGDLGNLLPSEIVMLPVENLNNSVNLDMNVLQASHIIASSNKNDSNGNGNNTVISDSSSNGSVNVSVTHPILTQME